MSAVGTGTFGQTTLAVMQAQMAIIKNNAELQQKTLEVLLEIPQDMAISSLNDRGNYVDVRI